MQYYDVDKILVLADDYYYSSLGVRKGLRDALLKKAIAPAVVIGVALAILPFVNIFIDHLTESENVKEDIKNIVDHLNDYKKSYGFGKYETQFTKFLKACTEFESSLNKLSSVTATKENVAEIHKEIQNFQNQMNEVLHLGPAIQGYLTQMESAGGKVLSTLMDFKFLPEAFGTDTIKVRNGINSLMQHITMEEPIITEKFKAIEEKYNQAVQEHGESPPDSKSTSMSTPSGNYKSIDKQIQKILGTKDDGLWGPLTQSALDKYKKTTGKQLTDEEAIEELKKTSNYKSGQPLFKDDAAPAGVAPATTTSGGSGVEQYAGITLE